MTKREKNRLHNQKYRARKRQERSVDVNCSTQNITSDDESRCEEDIATVLRHEADKLNDHPSVMQSEPAIVKPVQYARKRTRNGQVSAEQEIQLPSINRQQNSSKQSNLQSHNAGIFQVQPSIQQMGRKAVKSVTHQTNEHAHDNSESAKEDLHSRVLRNQHSSQEQSNQQPLSTREKNRLRVQQWRARKKQQESKTSRQHPRQKKGDQHFQSPVDLQQNDSATGVQLPRQKKRKHCVLAPIDLAYDMAHALVVGTHAKIEVASFQYPENDLNHTLEAAAEFQKVFSKHLPTGICAVCARRTAACDTVVHAIDNVPHLELLSCSRLKDEDEDEYPRHALTRSKIGDLEYCLDSNGIQGNYVAHEIEIRIIKYTAFIPHFCIFTMCQHHVR
jgi:hypothetical protein